MRKDSPVSALVLAAGASTRMGTTKQLLPFGGRVLLQHVLDTVRGSEVREVILVLGYSAEKIKQQLDLNGIKVVINENYDEGMGSSLKVGLATVESHAGAAIVMLADLPFVHSKTLDALIAARSRTDTQIVIPTYRGFRGNPVLLDRSVFAEAMAVRGDIGCRAIFGRHLSGIVTLPVEDVGILLDIDQRSDYEQLQSVDREKTFQQRPDLEGKGSGAIDPVRPELVIVGRESVVVALARLAHMLGFTVTIVDPLLTIAEVPDVDRLLHVLDFSLLPANSDRQVVVASRGACDEEAIRQALMFHSAFVGLVANKKRGEEVLRALGIKGVERDELARVRVPAGLEIGAKTPEEIALSILAEIVTERRKRLAARDHATAGISPNRR